MLICFYFINFYVRNSTFNAITVNSSVTSGGVFYIQKANVVNVTLATFKNILSAKSGGAIVIGITEDYNFLFHITS
jgi:hypothetical protein